MSPNGRTKSQQRITKQYQAAAAFLVLNGSLGCLDRCTQGELLEDPLHQSLVHQSLLGCRAQ